MELCFNHKNGKIIIKSAKELKDLKEKHGDIYNKLLQQLSGNINQSQFEFNYPPNQFFEYNNVTDNNFKSVIESFPLLSNTTETRHNLTVNVLTNVALPANKEAALIRLEDRNVVVIRSDDKTTIDKKLDHEFAHLMFDDILKSDSEFARKIQEKINDLREESQKKNLAEIPDSEIIPLLFEGELNDGFLDSKEFAGDLLDLYHKFKTSTIQPKIENYYDEPPFSTVAYDEVSLLEEPIFIGKSKDEISTEVFNVFEKARSFKGWTVREVVGDDFSLEARKDENNYSFPGIAYNKTINRFNDVDRLIREGKRDELVENPNFDVNYDIASLSQNDIVKVSFERTEKGEIKESTQFLPVVYNFPLDNKLIVAYRPKTGQHVGKTFLKAIPYDSVLGYATFDGLPKSKVSTSASFDDNLQTKEVIHDNSTFKVANDELYLSLKYNPQEANHVSQVKEMLETSDFVRVRWSREPKKVKEGEVDYYTTNYQVVDVHGSTATVVGKSKEGKQYTLVINLSQIDIIYKDKKNYIANNNTKIKEVKIVSEKITFKTTQADVETQSFEIVERYAEYKKITSEEAVNELLDRSLNSDWIKFKDIVNKEEKTLIGQIYKKDGNTVGVIFVAKDGKSFTKDVLISNVVAVFYDNTIEQKVHKATIDHFAGASKEQRPYLNEGKLLVFPFYIPTHIKTKTDAIDVRGDLTYYYKNLLPGDRIKIKYQIDENTEGQTTALVTRVINGKVYYTTINEVGEDANKKTHYKRRELKPSNLLEVYFLTKPLFGVETNRTSEDSIKKQLNKLTDIVNQTRQNLKVDAEVAENLHEWLDENGFEFKDEQKAINGTKFSDYYSYKAVIINNKTRYFKTTFKDKDKKEFRFVDKRETHYNRVGLDAFEGKFGAISRFDYLAGTVVKGETKFLIFSSTPILTKNKNNKYEPSGNYKLTLVDLSSKDKIYDREAIVTKTDEGYQVKIDWYNETKKKKETRILKDVKIGLLGGDRRLDIDYSYDSTSNKTKRTFNKTESGSVKVKTRSSRSASKATDRQRLRKFVERLNSNIGINAQLVNADEMRRQLELRGAYYTNAENIEKAFVDENGNIFINVETASTGDAFHEFVHTIFRSYEKVNPEAFAKLLDAAKQHVGFPEIQKRYPDYDENAQAEELITSLIQNKFETSDNSWWGRFKGVVYDFINHVRDYVNKVFGIKPSMLDAFEVMKMSLDEVIDFFGDSYMRKVEKVKESFDYALDSFHQEQLQKFNNRIVLSETGANQIINDNGNVSKLFDRIKERTNSFTEAVSIYSLLHTPFYKKLIAKIPHQIQDGEIPYSVVEKLFAKKVRASRLNVNQNADNIIGEKLNLANEVILDEDTHVYSLNGRKIQGNTETLTNENIITRYNEDDLKKSLFAKLNPSASLTTTDDVLKTRIDDFVSKINKLNEPGTSFHKGMEEFLRVMFDKVSNPNYNTRLSKAIERGFNTMLESDKESFFDGNDANLKTGFITFAKNLLNELTDNGTNNDIRVLPEQRLVYKDDNGKIQYAATADIVVVMPNGRVRIYDFKTSYHTFDEWNSYKKRAVVAQQLAQRNMATSMGLTVEEVYVIPVDFSVDFENTQITSFNSTVSSISVNNILEVTEKQKIQNEIDVLYPVTAKALTVVSESNVKIANTMELLFDYDIYISREETTDTYANFIKSDKFKQRLLSLIESHEKKESYTVIDKFDEKKKVISAKTELENAAVKKGLNKSDFKLLDINIKLDIYTKLFGEILHNEEKVNQAKYEQLVSWFKKEQKFANSNNYSPRTDIFFKSDMFNETLYNHLETYLYDPHWTIIESEELNELNIVAFKHELNNVVEFVVLSDKDLSSYHKNNKESFIGRGASGQSKGTILGKFMPTFQIIDEYWESTVRSYEALKVALFILNNPNMFEGTKIGVKNIIVSTKNVTSDVGDMKNDFAWFKIDEAISQLQKVVNSQYTEDIETDFDTQVRSFNKQMYQNMSTSYIEEAALHLNRVTGRLFDMARFHRETEAQMLKTKQVGMLEKKSFADYFNDNVVSKLEGIELTAANENIIQTVIDELRYLIDEVRSYKGGGLKVSKRNENTTSELVTLLESAWLELQGLLPSSTESMKKLGTISDGYMAAIPSTLTNGVAKVVTNLVREAENETVNALQVFVNDKAVDVVNELYKFHGMEKITSSLSHFITGNVSQAFDNLIETTEDGVFTMVLRNPDEKEGDYDYDSRKQRVLSKEERAFIRFFMDTINTRRKESMTSSQWDEFKSNPDNLRQLPLQKASSKTKLTKGTMRGVVGEYLDSFINPHGAFDEDQTFRQIQEERRFMPSTFDYLESLRGRAERANMIQKAIDDKDNSVFETNLELLLYTYVAANEKKKAFNKILPTINALKAHLVHQSVVFNQDNTNLIDFIDSYLDVAVFTKRDKSSSSDREISERTSKLIGGMQAATTMANLTLNFTSGASQMVEAHYQILAKVFGEMGVENRPNYADYLWAWTMVTTGAIENVADLSKLRELNKRYNMLTDIMNNPKYVTKKNSGLSSLTMKDGLILSTAPDYMGRMTLLLAYMKKEGVWDAHTLENGKLVYNVAKDKRFDKIFDSKGNLRNPKYFNSEEEQQQYARYQFFLEQSRKEKAVTEDNKPFRAFLRKEVDSIKNQGDAMFGSFNKTDKAIYSQYALASLMMQFQNYLRGIIYQHWFVAKGRSSEITGNYNVVKKQQYDPETNTYKDVLDENGNPTYETKWQGDYYEGMFNTVVYLFQALDLKNPKSIASNLTHNWENLPDNVKKVRLANLRKLFMELFIILINMLIGTQMAKLIQEEKEKAKRLRVKPDITALKRYEMIIGRSDDNMFLNFTNNFLKMNKHPMPAVGFMYKTLSNMFDAVGALASGEPKKAAKKLTGSFGFTKLISDSIDTKN